MTGDVFNNKNHFNYIKVRKMEEKVKARIVIDDRIRHGKPIINVLREFLSSLDVKEVENAVTIVELGRYRMRR